MELNKVICADSAKYLKTIPDDTFDCCVTDPPGWLVDENKKPLHWFYYFNYLKPILQDIQRVVKPGGLIAVFQNQMYLQQMFQFFPPQAKMFICAKKNYDYLCEWQVRDSKSKFRMQYDPIMMWYNANEGSNYEDADYFVCDNSLPDQKRNTRSLDVILYLLKAFSKGSVIDPFCGRGTTLVAAELLGRPYYGIDVDAQAVSDSIKRLPVAKQ